MEQTRVNDLALHNLPATFTVGKVDGGVGAVSWQKILLSTVGILSATIIISAVATIVACVIHFLDDEPGDGSYG